jgi:hypothetical protein
MQQAPGAALREILNERRSFSTARFRRQVAAMPDRRNLARHRFGHRYCMRIMDRQGAWQIPCTLIDVSQTRARLHLDAPVKGIELQEFILKLSQFGTAHRNCALAWHRGDFIGVRFLAPPRHPGSYMPRPDVAYRF